MRRRTIPISALAITVSLTGCDRLGNPSSPTGPGVAAMSSRSAVRDAEVWYTPPLARVCSSLATVDADDDWSFPSGDPGCLRALVSDRQGAPATGWVLWQVCFDQSRGGGPLPKLACENRDAAWTTHTDWAALVAGEVTAASHSTPACDGLKTTIGYRYLFAAGDPAARIPPDLGEPGANGRVAPSDAIDVTSDGTAGACP